MAARCRNSSCEVSRRLRSLLRAYDAAGRFGGEVFLLVLPGADACNARVVAERLGVACTDAVGFESSALILVADQALYRNKAAGRNRVEL
jgi:PleD family two-component response regulator